MVEDDTKGEEVVLRGTITEIRPARGSHPHQKWLAILAVDSVVAEHFSGQTFAFRIHSPTKSGIAVGGRYVIHATRTQTGEYVVRSIEPWRNEPA
jgi:hypothetical protein